jgi:hypothetical protein
MSRYRIPTSHRLLWSLFVSALSTACVTEMPTLGDEDLAVLARAEDYRSFQRINSAPFASGVKGSVNVWVSPEGAPAYAMLNTPNADAAPPVPEGTVIVREVLDPTGKVTKLTMMAKGPTGYQPELGDWWFAVTDPSFAPIYGEETWQVGRMPECHSCHVPHADEDFLFGVPTGMHQ